MNLKQKYKIEKTDGTPVSENARYFVLRIDKQDVWGKISRRALRQFARDVEVIMGDEEFAKELYAFAEHYTPEVGFIDEPDKFNFKTPQKGGEG